MNERIKLPAQEWLGYDPEKGDLHGYTFEQMREFAELIILECTNAVRDGTSQGDHFAQRIEEHFDNSLAGVLYYKDE